jgi:predicted MFS family arabinose efflux permease
VAVFNTTATIVADRVPVERLGQAMGFLGLSMLATNALAPAITEPLADRLGWGFAFSSAGVLALFALPIVHRLEHLPAAHAKSLDGGAHHVASPRLLAAYYASGLVGVGLGTMFTFAQPFALSLGAERLGDFFFGYVGAAVAMRILLAKIVDRVGTGRVALTALSLYGLVVLTAIGLRPSWLTWLGIGIGVAHGLVYPALTAFTLAGVSSKKRGAVMGWYTSAYHVGFSMSALGFGPLADTKGYPTVFGIAGLWMLSGIVPLGRAIRAPRPAVVRSGA